MATAKEITPEQFAKLKENARGILADTRKNMMQKFPFVGTIAMGLDLIPTRDVNNPTMCTDGSSIFCDIDFLGKLSADDRVFILGHEVYHCVMLHMLRKESRNHLLFNIATDLEVNQILIADGLTCPANLLLPKLYSLPEGLSAEDYYERLLKKCESQDKSGDNGSEGNGKSGQNGCGGQFDKHLYKDEEYDDNGERTDSYGKVGKDKDFRPNVTKEAAERIREKAVSAAQMIERQRGELPGHLKNLIKSFTDPKVDWRELLARFVSKGAGNIRSWNRCNRRFISSRTYLPSSYGDKLKVAVGIDTSGSIYSYLDEFLSELKGIVDNFDYELHIIQCDTDVNDVQMYDESRPLDLTGDGIEIHGGGGTTLKPIFDYVRDNELDIDVCVVLTDGACEEQRSEDAPEFPVLWCIPEDGACDMLKFGEIARLDRKSSN